MSDKKRGVYQWGKSEVILSIELDQEITTPCDSRLKASGWRAIACRLGVLCDRKYKTKHRNGILTIKRIK